MAEVYHQKPLKKMWAQIDRQFKELDFGEDTIGKECTCETIEVKDALGNPEWDIDYSLDCHIHGKHR